MPEEVIIKAHEETFEGDSYVHYLEIVKGFMSKLTKSHTIN